MLSLISIIDYKNIGLLGHSMGAMNLVDYLREHNNPNIKATILMDSGNMLSYHVSQEHKTYIIETPKMPTFLLWSANFKLNMNESMALNKSDYEVIFSPNLASESNFTNHENFSDYSTLQYHPAFAQPKVSPNLDVGSGDGYQVTTMINDYILNFYNHTLSGESTSLNNCQMLDANSTLSCAK